MVFGPTLLILAGMCATASLLVYATFGNREGGLKAGRIFYGAMTALVVVAAAYLMYLFLNHRFEFRYVFAYSSLEMPLKYVISSFWGGQEGTFLLWLTFGALLGFTIIAKGKHFERWTMVFYLVVQLFLLVVLAVRSPFAPTGFPVEDGRGLNPLLQNPWMVIHPPIVFLGFAALAIPFAYAMASLVQKDYRSFPRLVMPWVGLGAMTLGLGIFLGGYWAYITLGWGGYWGWDPVENSSLIPWIASLALLHGLLIQRRANKLIKTNLLLSIGTLLLVIYGTFLTRSGVLADFSVHSFTDLGINNYLVGFMLLVAVGGPAMLLARVRTIPAEKLESNPTSREFGLAVGMLILLTVGFLVFLGTSSPLITRLFGNPANVAMSYYHSLSIPAGIALLLILIIIPFTRLGSTPSGTLIKRLTWPAVIAAVVTIPINLIITLRLSDMLLVFLAFWALVANAYTLFIIKNITLPRLGGHLAHLGFAVMVLGVVASSNYGTAERITLMTGETEAALGYQLTYNERVEKPREEDSYLDVTLTYGDEGRQLRPKMYYSDYTKSYMRNPHVVESFTGDLYVAPLDLRVLEEAGGAQQLILAEHEPVPYGDYTLTFHEYETGDHMEGNITVGALITVAGPTDTVDVKPQFFAGVPADQQSPAVAIPGTDLSIALVGIMVESRSVAVMVNDPAMAEKQGVERLTLEVSRKPFTSFVWLGVGIITLGTVLSIVRRWTQVSD